ncbi:CAP domain-containing protein [Corynebacterium mastitidis]|nr:CAP domain-containing protein [Corynebacterium mastitidis]MCH6197413.1 CAP domain-containing protein [Corynebacterium mastitidis]
MTRRYVFKGLACAIALTAGMSGAAVAAAEEASATETTQASGQSAAIALAKEIFELTNAAREDQGLDVLRYDSTLGWTAQQWAEEMCGNSMVGHSEDAEVENVAWFGTLPSADEVLRVWMENPGAKENVLDPEMHKIGIGIAQAEDGSYVVQRFGA